MLTSMHLVEMESLFADVAYSSHSNFESLYDSSLRICPDFTLHHSDEYLAAVITKLSQSEGIKNIFVVCGYG